MRKLLMTIALLSSSLLYAQDIQSLINAEKSFAATGRSEHFL